MTGTTQDETLAQIEAMQKVQFEQKMRTHQLVGDLTNWRTNFTNNSTRSKVLSGYDKISSLMSRAISGT